MVIVQQHQVTLTHQKIFVVIRLEIYMLLKVVIIVVVFVIFLTVLALWHQSLVQERALLQVRQSYN